MHLIGIRKFLFEKFEKTSPENKVGRWIDFFLIALIAINITAVILETVESIHTPYQAIFYWLEHVSVFIFTIEYLIRLWVCVEHPESAERRFTRLRYMLTPMAIIDLIAILPFYLSFFVTFDLRFLRVFRLLRVFKLTRYSSAMSILLDVFRKESSTLFAGFFILMILLIFTASGAYLVEHHAQPDKFSSIPQAMWWAVATLTTVGYGDVTPITPIGQIFGALVAVIGIGMAALPAGILASGLADQLQRNRKALMDQLRIALEDGIIDAEEETQLEDFRKSLGISQKIAQEVREEVLLNQRLDKKRPLLCCPHCGGDVHVPASLMYEPKTK